MAQFSDIMKGKRARRTVAFPLPNTRISLTSPLAGLEALRSAHEAGKPQAVAATEPGRSVSAAPAEPMLVDLVVLLGTEEAEALAGARAYAVARGVADPQPNSPLFDLALMAHTLLHGCVDHDSREDAPTPFFKSAEQILGGMTRDQITWLHTQHEVWVNELAPDLKNGDEDAFFAWVKATAESESPSDFFGRSGPALLWNFTVTLARLLLTLQPDRSPVGSTSETSTSESTSQESEPVKEPAEPKSKPRGKRRG